MHPENRFCFRDEKYYPGLTLYFLGLDIKGIEHYEDKKSSKYYKELEDLTLDEFRVVLTSDDYYQLNVHLKAMIQHQMNIAVLYELLAISKALNYKY